MQTDVNLLFSGATGTAQNIAGSANVASTGTLDLAYGLMLTGATYDNPALNFKIPPNQTIFGEDLGVGTKRLQMTAFVSSTLPFVGPGATLNIAYQGGIDPATGLLANVNWVTFAETSPYLTAALMTASTMIPLPDFSRRALAALGTNSSMPRFIRILYQVTGTFTQGSIAWAGMSLIRGDGPTTLGNYGGGFVVAQ